MADDAGEIYYDPDDWENLSDALKRVGEDDLYLALREGKLPWLFLAADFDPYHPTGAIDRRTMRPVEVEAPPAIGPRDFHSGSSQPVKLWRRKKAAWPEHDFAFWVVVFKADVPILRAPASVGRPAAASNMLLQIIGGTLSNTVLRISALSITVFWPMSCRPVHSSTAIVACKKTKCKPDSVIDSIFCLQLSLSSPHTDSQSQCNPL
jgi:hypothetical protein